jgi:arginase family enzyme
MKSIGREPGLAAVELVEYCPPLDAQGCSARIAVDLLEAVLCGNAPQP